MNMEQYERERADAAQERANKYKKQAWFWARHAWLFFPAGALFGAVIMYLVVI